MFLCPNNPEKDNVLTLYLPVYIPDNGINVTDDNAVTEEEIQAMKEAEEKMYLPYDETLGINPQDDSFLQKPIWDLENL